MPRFNGIRKVESVIDIMAMRKVRNTCREFMTQNTDEISPMQQLKWYAQTYLPANRQKKLFGFLVVVEGKTVGYGLLRYMDGAFWVTGGLLPEVRGQGKGKSLFSFLNHYALYTLHQNEVRLQVRADNLQAIKLYTGLGYEMVEEPSTDWLLTMKLDGQGGVA